MLRTVKPLLLPFPLPVLQPQVASGSSSSSSGPAHAVSSAAQLAAPLCTLDDPDAIISESEDQIL